MSDTDGSVDVEAAKRLGLVGSNLESTQSGKYVAVRIISRTERCIRQFKAYISTFSVRASHGIISILIA
jgi:hypothetical protein